MRKQMLRQPTPPGEILLEEFLKPMQLSQTAFARHVGWGQPKVNEIIQGRRGITPKFPYQLVLYHNTSRQA